MGLPSYIKTTQIPFPEASHSTIKVFVKFGIPKTSASHIASLRCSKALDASEVNENAYLFNNVIRGGDVFP